MLIKYIKPLTIFFFILSSFLFAQSGKEVTEYPRGFSERALRSLRAEMSTYAGKPTDEISTTTRNDSIIFKDAYTDSIITVLAVSDLQAFDKHNAQLMLNPQSTDSTVAGVFIPTTSSYPDIQGVSYTNATVTRYYRDRLAYDRSFYTEMYHDPNNVDDTPGLQNALNYFNILRLGEFPATIDGLVLGDTTGHGRNGQGIIGGSVYGTGSNNYRSILTPSGDTSADTMMHVLGDMCRAQEIWWYGVNGTNLDTAEVGLHISADGGTYFLSRWNRFENFANRGSAESNNSIAILNRAENTIIENTKILYSSRGLVSDVSSGLSIKNLKVTNFYDRPIYLNYLWAAVLEGIDIESNRGYTGAFIYAERLFDLTIRAVYVEEIVTNKSFVEINQPLWYNIPVTGDTLRRRPTMKFELDGGVVTTSDGEAVIDITPTQRGLSGNILVEKIDVFNDQSIIVKSRAVHPGITVTERAVSKMEGETGEIAYFDYIHGSKENPLYEYEHRYTIQKPVHIGGDGPPLRSEAWINGFNQDKLSPLIAQSDSNKYALYFDGTSSTAEASGSNATLWSMPDGESFTLIIWLEPTGVNPYGFIMDRFAGTERFFVRLTETTVVARFYNSNFGYDETIIGLQRMARNVPQMLAFVGDAADTTNGLRMYINGGNQITHPYEQYQADYTTHGVEPSSGVGLTIGEFIGLPYSGYIGDMALFRNIALDSTELDTVYNYGNPPDLRGWTHGDSLKAYFRWEEGLDATTFYNSVGTGETISLNTAEVRKFAVNKKAYYQFFGNDGLLDGELDADGNQTISGTFTIGGTTIDSVSVISADSIHINIGGYYFPIKGAVIP